LKLNIGPAVGCGCSGRVSTVLEALDGGRYVLKEVATGTTADAALAEEVRLHRLCSQECSSVVRYAFACQTEDALLVLMEQCDAVLWDALTNEGAWSSLATPSQPSRAERWAWTQGLCEAVRHCHRLCVVHRDINPWNVFLRASGKADSGTQQNSVRFLPRLADFGLAVQLHNATDELHGACSEGAAPLDDSALGSLYSAPELGKDYGLPADIFSLGMTLFALWSSCALDGEALIEAVVATKEAAVACQDPPTDLLQCQLVQYEPSCADVQLCALVSSMLKPVSCSRPTADDVYTCLRTAAAVPEGVERVFANNLPQGRSKMPRLELVDLLSRLGLKGGAQLLEAASQVLGWGSHPEEVDYKAFLRWIYSDEVR